MLGLLLAGGGFRWSPPWLVSFSATAVRRWEVDAGETSQESSSMNSVALNGECTRMESKQVQVLFSFRLTSKSVHVVKLFSKPSSVNYSDSLIVRNLNDTIKPIIVQQQNSKGILVLDK